MKQKETEKKKKKKVKWMSAKGGLSLDEL